MSRQSAGRSHLSREELGTGPSLAALIGYYQHKVHGYSDTELIAACQTKGKPIAVTPHRLKQLRQAPTAGRPPAKPSPILALRLLQTLRLSPADTLTYLQKSGLQELLDEVALTLRAASGFSVLAEYTGLVYSSPLQRMTETRREVEGQLVDRRIAPVLEARRFQFDETFSSWTSAIDSDAQHKFDEMGYRHQQFHERLADAAREAGIITEAVYTNYVECLEATINHISASVDDNFEQLRGLTSRDRAKQHNWTLDVEEQVEAQHKRLYDALANFGGDNGREALALVDEHWTWNPLPGS